MQALPATPDHLGAIMPIIDEARAIMRETGNLTQWINGYPSADAILQDIRAGHGFVCCTDGNIAGYFCFIKGKYPEPTYRIIEDGNWLNDQPYGVIHRLASGRTAKGVARCAFDFAFSRIDNVRVDTHRDNVPMKRFLEKDGFVYCGVIYVGDGTPRDAYQKEKA